MAEVALQVLPYLPAIDGLYGEVSPKQLQNRRNILIKRAQELGIDTSDVEAANA